MTAASAAATLPAAGNCWWGLLIVLPGVNPIGCDEMIPARFHRDPGSRIVGLLTHIAVLPILSMFLALFLSLPIFILVEFAGLPEAIAVGCGIAAFPVVFVGLTLWSVRDYQRRASEEVVIRHDRIEVTTRGQRNEIGFHDIRSVRLAAGFDMACILQPASGKPIRLPQEIASYSLVCAPLEQTLIADLQHRLPRRLAAGEEIPLRDSTARAFLLLTLGSLALLLVVLLYLSIAGAGLARRMFPLAWRFVCQGYLAARGGFVLRREGIVPDKYPAGKAIRWADVVILRNDDCGITLRLPSGETASASSLAEDYWPVSRWFEQH